MSTISQPTIQFRLIKSLDISYLTLIYFIFGIGISMPIDTYLGKFDPVLADTKPTISILFEIFAHVAILGVIIYIVRNLVEKIPSPFEGIAGLQHKKLKELGNASVFVFFLMFYQKHLIDKMNYLYNRLKN